MTVMRQYNKVLPVLGMALYFCSVNLGAGLTAASRSFSGSGKLPMLFHMGGIFAMAVFLSFCLWRRSALPRLLPHFIAAVAMLCLAVPFFTASESTLSWEFLLPPAIAMCLYLPVGLHLFFAAVPVERQGLVLGCAMAAGELVWIAVLPLLHLFLSSSHSPEPVLYLYKFLGFSMAGIGACFAVTLAEPSGRPVSAGRPGLVSGKGGALSGDTRDASGAAHHPKTATGAGRQPFFRSRERQALFLLLLAGVAFYTLFGLMLRELPRASSSPLLAGPHFFLLLTAPAAGLFLDKTLSGSPFRFGKGSACSLRFPVFILTALALPALLTPFLGMIAGHGLSGGLSVPLLAIRQMFLLVILVLANRLTGHGPFFPLLGSLTWGLMLLHLVGIWLGDLFDTRPVAQTQAAFVLACACALCLWSFLRTSAPLPQLQKAPPPGTPPLQDAWSLQETRGEENSAVLAARLHEEAKLRAFAAALDLTAREEEILRGILGGLDNAAMAASVDVSERTVRHHIGGLLKKTGVSNRKRLQHYYTSWKA